MKKTIITFVLMFTGCATSTDFSTPCPTAREIASGYGQVIGCFEYTYPDSGEKADRCLVKNPKTGIIKPKTIFAYHCGL